MKNIYSYILFAFLIAALGTLIYDRHAVYTAVVNIMFFAYCFVYLAIAALHKEEE